MALELTVTDRWHDGKRTHVIGTIAASGNYVADGDTLNLVEGLSQNPPKHVEIHGKDAYIYQFVPGENCTDGKVIVRDGAALCAQLAAAAYPAAVVADVIRIHAIFDSLK